MNNELIKNLRSFADYHESLWPEMGMGIAQVVMRNAIDEIVKLENRITELESPALPDEVQAIADYLRGLDNPKDAELIAKLARDETKARVAANASRIANTELRKKIEKLEESRRTAIRLYLQGMRDAALQALREDKE